MKHLLDQPVWNALQTGNSNLSQGEAEGKFFDKMVAPFADVEVQDTAHFEDLYDIIPDNREVVLFSLSQNLNFGPWKVMQCIDTLQMIYNGSLKRGDSKADSQAAGKVPNDLITRSLENADIPAMLALTAQTKPGPFLERTIDFGHFLGSFDNNKLVAMAGQRLHPGTFAEISGVCTHPDYAGMGLARQLITRHIQRIMDSGETPFLHVKSSNLNAVKLYESIGFTVRAQLQGYVLQK